MPSILNMTRSDLRNIAESAISAKGAFARLDYSAFAQVGAMADCTADVPYVAVGTRQNKTNVEILALDPSQDTKDNAQSRAAARRNLLGNLTRNARSALNVETLDLAHLWADVPAPTKDNADAVTRAYVVERTK